jgi:hypothetical protein
VQVGVSARVSSMSEVSRPAEGLNEAWCMPIAWRSIPAHTQVDVLLAEQLRHGEMMAVVRWAHMCCDKAMLRHAMEERGRVWDSNQLPAGVQRMFLLTAAHYVSADWRALQIKNRVMRLLG